MALDRASSRALGHIMDGGVGALDHSDVTRIRAIVDRIAELNGPGPRMVRVSEHRPTEHRPTGTGSPEGQPRIRLLQPVDEPRGLIISLGMGGWVAGSPDAEDTVARKLAERTSCTVALIDHRRAPEHRYPAAADDLYTAARWLWDRRRDLGHEGLAHMILGEGMGAALAIVTAARAGADPDGPRFALQLLVCPVTDARASGRGSTPGPLFTGDELDRFWDWYLAEPSLRLHPEVSPSMIRDAATLPPTVLVTAEYDPAGADGAAFAEQLRASGTPVAHRHYEGQMHGLLAVVAIPLGERVFQHLVRAVRGYTARFSDADPPRPAEMGEWLNRIIK